MAISTKQWLSVLLSENGASYYVDSMGVVQLSLVPKPLANMFDGWEGILLNYGRSAKYLGLDRTFTSQYKFVKDGATILRSLLYTNQSIESKVYLGLVKWSADNGTYELYYKAEIDLSQVLDDPATGVTVEIMQDGPAKYIKNNDNVTYELDCEGLTLNLDGVRYTCTDNVYLPEVVNLDRPTYDPVFYLLPTSALSSDGLSVGIKRGDQAFEETSNPASIETLLEASNNYLLSPVSQDILVRVRGTFSVTWSSILSHNVELALYAYPIITPLATGVYPILTLAYGGTFPDPAATVNYDAYITVRSGVKLFLGVSIDRVIGPAPDNLTVSSTEFSLTYDTRFQATTAPAIRPVDLFKELISKMTDGKFVGSSTLLQQNEHLAVLSGDAIRGITSPKVQTTFSDFFSSYSKILKGALGVDFNTQTVLFEDRSYFYAQDVEIFDLGDVSDLTIEIAKEFIYNSIKVGYTSQKTEEAVAREEVNATQQYRTPITRVKKELDLIVPYRTDIFGIERLRAEYNSVPNTDSKADNDVFIININRTADEDGGYSVYRPTYTSITGGTNMDSWYNIEQLSPKRILKTNADLLGCLYSLPSSLVKFESADKNASVITVLDGVTTVENGNIRVSDLDASYFRPFLLKFTTKVPENVVTLLQEARGGYITGTWKGTRFYGYAQEVTVKPVFDEAQEWTLLVSSQMNPSVLSTINEQGLTIENMGIISHKLPVKFVKVGTSYPLQHHFKQMDIDWFANRIGRYSQQQPYFQKWQTNDSFDVQFITQGLAASLAIIDCNGVTVDTVSLTETSNPSVVSPNILYQGTVDCSVLTAGEVYYLLATFGTGEGEVQFVTEPMLIAVDWPETVLVGYSNTSNQPDLIWNAPFSGKIRVEGFIQDFQPGGRFTQYEDQPLDIMTLDSEPTRSYQLLVGSDFGLPDWMADKMNRILMLDTITIDGYGYSLDKDATLEAIYTTGAPMAYWTVRIREANNRAGIAIDGDGINGSPLTVVYNVNTKGFSSNQSPSDQTDTIIQITAIE